MSIHIIEQPKDTVIRQNGLTLTVRFTPHFAADWQTKFNNAQKMFDTECLRLCNQNYVPFLTGNNLMASGLRASKLGEGQLIWDANMAGHLYYHDEFNFTKTHPRAGGHWGQRMKADNLTHLQQFAAGALKKG